MDHRLGFEPVRGECAGVSLPVEGDLPNWLSGTLLRNGPGTFEAGDRRLNHWFDGFAMLRRFAIRGGRVTYANRFLRSEAHEHVREHGELGFREFATDPDTGLVGRLERLLAPNFTDNACVNLEARRDGFVATTESPRVVGFDPGTLATEPEIVGEVSVDEPAYLHSFGLTERHVVLTEGPFVVRPLDLLRDRPVIEGFEWKPERGTRFLVVDRASGDVAATHRAEPFFLFHHVNAFETGGEIVLDLVAYPDATVVDALSLDNLRSPAPDLPTGALRRYRLPIEDGGESGGGASGGGAPRIGFETLYPGHIELPTFDYERRNTRPYRYVYGVSNRERPPADFQNQLVKVDVGTRTTRTWSEPDAYPGEPLFVPAPEGQEDEGVVLSVVLDARAERSFLVVLDAATFAERARAPTPHPIPFGFHGQFYRDDEPTRSMA
ncbi:beta-carotene 15,15'-monooxygenase [Halobacteriales archaeon SW_12_67_38]|nr:MAG: beta-carotene 15,15'-monooxygenase [Halobacteriales archaeon SW_12_67_38]